MTWSWTRTGRCAALPVWRRRGGWCVSTSQAAMRSICAICTTRRPTLAEMLGYMAERNYEYDFDVDELLFRAFGEQ